MGQMIKKVFIKLAYISKRIWKQRYEVKKFAIFDIKFYARYYCLLK
jgi:hypothetical protein